MCYGKKEKEKKKRKKAKSTCKPSLQLTVQSYAAWQNAATGGCKAQSKPRDIINCLAIRAQSA